MARACDPALPRALIVAVSSRRRRSSSRAIPDAHRLLGARQAPRDLDRPLLREQRARPATWSSGQRSCGFHCSVLLSATPRPDPLAVVDQEPQVELRAGQRRRRQRLDSRGQRGPGDGDRVDLVALATLAARAPRAGHQPCRDPNHALAARDQKPLQRARDMAAILQRPDPFAGKAARPDHSAAKPRGLTPITSCRRRAWPVSAIDGSDRVRTLVGVRPEHDHELVHIPSALQMLDARRTGYC